jgi:hypothetical protein
MKIVPRLPFEPFAKYLPESNAVRILGTSSNTLKRAKIDGLTVQSAQRWSQRLGIDPTSVWPEMADPLMFRFNSGFVKGGVDECWNWIGYKDDDGYGFFYDGDRLWRAPEFSLTTATGEDRNGRDTCHSCHHPSCVNPNHLRFDSHQSNVEDCVSSGRLAHGSKAGASLIDEDDVLEIREAYSSGESSSSISSRFPISAATVRSIVSGRRWKRVGGPTFPGRTPGRPNK